VLDASFGSEAIAITASLVSTKSHAPSRFSRTAGWSSPAEAPTPSRSPGIARAVRSMGRFGVGG